MIDNERKYTKRAWKYLACATLATLVGACGAFYGITNNKKPLLVGSLTPCIAGLYCIGKSIEFKFKADITRREDERQKNIEKLIDLLK